MELFSGVHAPQPLTTVIQRIPPRPLLLVSTGTGIEKRQAEKYYQIVGIPKEHWNLPKSSHGHAVYTDRAEYEQRMIQFFKEGLLKQ